MKKKVIEEKIVKKDESVKQIKASQIVIIEEKKAAEFDKRVKKKRHLEEQVGVRE